MSPRCITYNNEVEENYGFNLLAGLNFDYDPVRVQIMGKLILSQNDVYSYLHHVESCQNVMMTPLTVERSALTTSHYDG